MHNRDSYRMTREEVIARLEALAEHLTPDVLDASNNAAWREACRDGAALLRGPSDEALWDKCRLDYLAAEKAEEEKDIAKIGHVKMHSVFRRNVPITREAIDDAMRFRESINRERDSLDATPSYTGEKNG
jgi:hypothetical protein